MSTAALVRLLRNPVPENDFLERMSPQGSFPYIP
jgi:hypothetical protein